MSEADVRRPFDAATFVALDRLGALLGARFVSLTSDECRYEYDVDQRHFNPAGILHGGTLFTVMDTSQGMLVISLLDASFRAAATGTATIKYLAPVREGRIAVRTTLTRREGRKFFVHSDALDAQGTSVAILDEIWVAIPA